MSKLKRFMLSAVACGLISPATVTVTMARGMLPDPAAYPELDDKQLGHINHIIALSRQLPADWSGMASIEGGQEGFDAYRYQLAFMSYTLSLANDRFTPAYRELYEDTDNRLISKMISFNAWEDWIISSRGVKWANPDLTWDSRVPEQLDPVAKNNVMYSGHLFQMIVTHQMLYNDTRYTKPGAIVFVYRKSGFEFKFPYDTTALAKVLYSQFEETGWKGIACEPNAVFIECNQHPILGFKLYDYLNGTKYFSKVSTEYLKQFRDINYLDPKTKSYHLYYMAKQKTLAPIYTPWNDGWAGLALHGWNRDEVESVYPQQIHNDTISMGDGVITTKNQPPFPHYWGHGFMMALASEVGDTTTKDAMLAYADKYWSPIWENGQLIYPRNDKDSQPGDAPGVSRTIGPLTANGLIGFTRLDSKDGFYNLYDRPFSPEHFKEPYMEGVNYPAVEVLRAIYDAKAKALVMTLRPGFAPAVSRKATWNIANLDAKGKYTLWSDGKRLADLNAGSITDEASNDVTLAIDAGKLSITADLAAERSFIITRD